MKKRILLGVGLLALALIGCSESKPAPTEPSKPEVTNPKVSDISFLSSTLASEYNVNEAKSIISLTLPDEIEEFNFDVFKFKTDIEGKSITCEFKNEANEVIDYNQKLKRGLTRYYLDLRCDDYKEIWTIEVTWNRPNEVSLVSATGKKNYKLNEKFLFIDVNYILNGEKKVKSFTSEDVIGFDSTTVGKKKLSYILEGVSYEYEYEVVDEYKSGYFKVLNDKYYIGDELKFDIEYELNGEIKTKSFDKSSLLDYNLSNLLDGFEFTKPCRHSFYVIFDSYYNYFDIEVLDAKSSIQVDSFKRIYTVGDTLGGGAINVYKNNTVEKIDITSDMITGLDLSKEGVQTVTITYEGMTANFDVLVRAKNSVNPNLPEGEELDIAKVKKMLAINRVIPQYGGTCDFNDYVLKEIAKITDEEASTYKLYLMATGLKATDLDALISFTTKHASYLYFDKLEIPTNSDDLEYYKDLDSLINLFTNDQLVELISFKEAIKDNKIFTFEVISKYKPDEPLLFTYSWMFEYLEREDLKDLFKHEDIIVDKEAYLGFMDVLRGIVFFYKNNGLNRMDYSNEIPLIEFLYNDEKTATALNTYLDAYFNALGEKKYNYLYNDKYVAYKLFRLYSADIIEMMRLYPKYKEDFHILDVIQNNYSYNRELAYSKALILSSLNNLKDAYGPILNKIKNDNNLNQLLIFGSARVLKLIERAYELKNFDYSLVEEIFKNEGTNVSFNSTPIIIKRGTSYEEFCNLASSGELSFINEDEIRRDLNIVGEHYAFAHHWHQDGYNYKAYLVYDNTNAVAYNDNKMLKNLEDYIIYEDNDGLKALHKYNFFDVNKTFISIDDILDFEFSFLVNNSIIFERTLARDEYELSIIPSKSNELDLAFLEVKTIYGSFYFPITYVNAKTLKISDISFIGMGDNRRINYYDSIEVGHEAKANVIFNDGYLIHEVTIKKHMYDQTKLGWQEVEIEYNGVAYKHHINVVSKEGAKVVKSFSFMQAHKDYPYSSLTKFNCYDITGCIREYKLSDLKRVYINKYNTTNIRLELKLLGINENGAGRYKLDVYVNDEHREDYEINCDMLKDEDINKVEVYYLNSGDYIEVEGDIFADDIKLDKFIKNYINNLSLDAKGALFNRVYAPGLLDDLEKNNIPYEIKLKRYDENVFAELFINSVRSGFELEFVDKEINRSIITELHVYGDLTLQRSVNGYTDEELLLHFTSANPNFTQGNNSTLVLSGVGKYGEFEVSLDEVDDFIYRHNLSIYVQNNELIVKVNGVEARLDVKFIEPVKYETESTIFDDSTHKGFFDLIKNEDVIRVPSEYKNRAYQSINIKKTEVIGDDIVFTYTATIIGHTEERTLKAKNPLDYSQIVIYAHDHNLKESEVNEATVKNLLYLRRIINMYSGLVYGLDLDTYIESLNYKLEYRYIAENESIYVQLLDRDGLERDSIIITKAEAKPEETDIYISLTQFDIFFRDTIVNKTIEVDKLDDRPLNLLIRNTKYIDWNGKIYSRGSSDLPIMDFFSYEGFTISEDLKNNKVTFRIKGQEVGFDLIINEKPKAGLEDIKLERDEKLMDNLTIENLALFVTLSYKIDGRYYYVYEYNLKLEILSHYRLFETFYSYELNPDNGGFMGFDQSIVINK